MRAAKSIGVFLLILIALCGCGSSNRETAQVTGTVTHNGEPVAGATVVLGPASGQARGATGITDSSGHFTLTTFDKNDGAIPGTFSVAISKTATVGGMTPDEEHAAISAGQRVQAAETRDELPARYRDGRASGLTAEVAADRENELHFELTD